MWHSMYSEPPLARKRLSKSIALFSVLAIHSESICSLTKIILPRVTGLFLLYSIQALVVRAFLARFGLKVPLGLNMPGFSTVYAPSTATFPGPLESRSQALTSANSSDKD